MGSTNLARVAKRRGQKVNGFEPCAHVCLRSRTRTRFVFLMIRSTALGRSRASCKDKPWLAAMLRDGWMMVGMLIERFMPNRTVGGVGGVVAARARRESGDRGAGIGVVPLFLY